MTFYLKIYESFSFLIQMLQSVFYDMRYFLLFFTFFISAFAAFLSVILQNNETTYRGLGAGAFFMMALRTSIGDNEMGDYEES